MTTPNQQLENELALRPDRVLIVTGVGVSLATCDNHPHANWKGLLDNGLDQCSILGVAESRIERYRGILGAHESTVDDLVSVATFITIELRNFREGEYGRWLAQVFGAITPVDRRLVRALAALRVKLATTNYDHLLEAGCSGSAITWRETARCVDFLRGGGGDVLHLHGSWQQPESVVLGHSSYEEVCRDESLQMALRSCMMLGTLIFVGCGDGLEPVCKAGVAEAGWIG